MAHIKGKDFDGNPIYIEGASGAGTSGDPIRPKHDVSGSSVAVSNLPSDPTTGTAQTAGNTKLDTVAANIGATNETVAASDTATGGLNSLVKRLLQRVTTLIGLFPGTLGQKTKAGSFAVTLASDQDALAVSGTITANIGTVATLATAAKQPALGTAGSASADVISVQGVAGGTTLPVSGTVTANLGTIAGVATAVNQTTANSSLGSIDGKLGTLGQKAMAGSAPVVIASDQSAVPVSGTITANIGTAGTLATAAKQPAPGTAGTPSSDVITVQGVTAGTALPTREASIAASTSDVNAPASNTAAVVTYAAAGAGVSHVVGGIAWSYSAAPTGGNLKIEDGSGTTVFTMDITAAGAGYITFPRPKKGTANTAMIITLAAGGGSVTGKVSMTSHYTE